MNSSDAVFLHGRDLLCETFAFMHSLYWYFFSSMKCSWHTRHMGLSHAGDEVFNSIFIAILEMKYVWL